MICSGPFVDCEYGYSMQVKDLVNQLVADSPDGHEEIILMDKNSSITYTVDSVINQLGEVYILIEESP